MEEMIKIGRDKLEKRVTEEKKEFELVFNLLNALTKGYEKLSREEIVNALTISIKALNFIKNTSDIKNTLLNSLFELSEKQNKIIDDFQVHMDKRGEIINELDDIIASMMKSLRP